LQAEKSVAVTTETGGKIITLVQDGKFVKQGEVLIEMDRTDLEREVNERILAHKNALADVDREKAELALLKESNKTDLEKAQAESDFKESQLRRSKAKLDKLTRLLKEKLVPGTDVEDQQKDVEGKELEVLLASKSLAIKKKEIESKEQQKQADVRNKEFAASLASSNVEDRKARLSQAKIVAPTSGMVVLSITWMSGGERRKWKAGDNPWPRSTICELPDLSSMQVKVQVGEADAPRLELGRPVLIRLEAVKKKLFHGTVKEVSRLVKEADPWDLSSTAARRSFEVTVAIKEVDTKTLKPGMTADVEFVCDTIPNTLWVPIESVMERDGKTYVFARTGKKFKLTRVKTGLANDNSIVIAKGLKKNAIVALRDPNEPTEPVDSEDASGSKDGKQADQVKEKTPTVGTGKT
jgi:HlyD family secretion protein